VCCTYAHRVRTVSTWGGPTPHLIVQCISILQDWETRQIYFVLAFPQADVECDLYMQIPPGFDVKEAKKKFCLKLQKNIYGTKQAGRVWNKHLRKRLIKLGYTDPWVYYKGQTVFMVYVDDEIFAGPDRGEINNLLEELKDEFTITDEGDLKEYVGVLVEKQAEGRTKLSQPHLIKQILDDLWSSKRTKSKPKPGPGSQVLQREIDAEAMTDDFHYRSVVGKTNFLEKLTRPDIAVATHQCARFSLDPKQSHADALRYIGKYLIGTKDEGIYLDPCHDKLFECWVDADFFRTVREGSSRHASRCNDCQAAHRIIDHVCGLSDHLGLKVATRVSTLNHQVRIHGDIRAFPGPTTNDGPVGRSTRKGSAGEICSTYSSLQGI
jgi:hypothetical protein